MWELDYKESWALKNWCFWTVVLEKTLESPLDSKEIQPVNLIGNQSWIFIGRTYTESEAPILWPPDANCLIGKDLMWGKIEGTKRRDNRGWDGWMVSLTGWTWVWALGVGDGQRNLVCCSPQGHKESDTTEWVNWTELLRRVLLLDSKEIKPINLKGNQPWILIGRTDAEVETTVFWSSDVNS